MNLIPLLLLFIPACITGHYVVRSMTSGRHMMVMAMASAMGAVIVIGGSVACSETTSPTARALGLACVALCAVALVGGFAIVERLLALDEKQDRN